MIPSGGVAPGKGIPTSRHTNTTARLRRPKSLQDLREKSAFKSSEKFCSRCSTLREALLLVCAQNSEPLQRG